ncbi:helix-turn-helix domain-containing protein [Cellulomonas timonensis]|uniref:helix-turn-helix domain-containing protein n=1 Tax=Cellulomonas timonensis TaxID=1689271 RepID=UPI000835E7E6|nr:helix-turn-helix transcriptional regulator [Cellulomonas timonensis]
MQTNLVTQRLTQASLAATLRAECARRSVGQSALALHLGLSQPAVSRRLRGDVPLTVPELAAVAELLGMSPEDLLAAARTSPVAPLPEPSQP